MSKIALQLYSVREVAEKDFLGTVSRVADMGYDGIQFAGFFDTPAKELKKVMDEKGIVAAGSHVPFDQLQGDQLQKTLEYNREIGNNLLICPWLPEELRKTGEDYKKVADELNEIGKKCKEEGFTFAYHNHDFEFNAFEDGTGFDILFGNSDSDYVKVELDCYWATYADLDPQAIIEQYGDRVVSLHIKDMKEENGEKRSIEIGSGVLDIASLLNVGKQFGVEWFIVEQEKFDGETMESSKINIDNIKAFA